MNDGKTYTQETRQALEEALADAKEVNDSATASQQDVDTATANLNTAIAALQEETSNPVDKTQLNAAIQAAQAKKADGKTYSTDTMTALDEALEAAQELPDTATQEEVDAAKDALNAAIDSLRYNAGDVDGNGQVTAADALMVLQAATQKITLDAVEQAAADVNDETGINAADALMVLQAATQKIVLA